MSYEPDKPKTTKCALYTRVSDPQQVKKGHGLKSQEAICREYAAYRGYEVDAVFAENLTGRLADRPVMNELLEYLQKHRHEGRIVIVDDVSRFARGHRAHWPLRDEIFEAGGFLESPVAKFGNTADENLVEGMLVTMAQHQREKGAEQTKSRMRGRVINGYWPFYVCRGYRHEHRRGEGKVLVRDEPAASILQEALEGFASGRFQTQAEVGRFLSRFPQFGRMTNQTVQNMLTKPLYAGYVGKAEWGIPLRQGQHEGLISIETFDKIQKRLNVGHKVATRRDINDDFPLRGAVDCDECGRPLTACWSTSKTGDKHGYYQCFSRDCARKRKSIRKNQIEGDFVDLLDHVVPRQQLGDLLMAMLKDIWEQRSSQALAFATDCRREAAKLEKQIEGLLDRIVDAGSDAVIRAYEKRISKMEREALVLREKAENAGRPKKSFEELFELAIRFLGNPRKLWETGDLNQRRLALKLTFGERLRYCLKSGFRTPKTAFPFKLLEGLSASFKEMAEGVTVSVKVGGGRKRSKRINKSS